MNGRNSEEREAPERRADQTKIIIHSTNRFETLRPNKLDTFVSEEFEQIATTNYVNSAATGYKQKRDIKTRTTNQNTYIQFKQNLKQTKKTIQNINSARGQ